MKTVFTYPLLDSHKLRIGLLAGVFASIMPILAGCQISSSPTPATSPGVVDVTPISHAPVPTARLTSVIANATPATLALPPTATATPQVIKTRQPTQVFIPFLTPVRISTRRPEEATVLSKEELNARWLSGTPCRPPCWEGVIPGKTSVQEAFDILSANPLFTQVEIDRFPEIGYIVFRIHLSPVGFAGREGDVLFHPSDVKQTVYMVRLPGLFEQNLGELIQALLTRSCQALIWFW